MFILISVDTACKIQCNGRSDILWNLSPSTITFRTSNVVNGCFLPCDDAALRRVEAEAALDGGDDDVGEDHALHDGRQTQARQQPPRAQPQGGPPVGASREYGVWLR